jgi:hypothetical protein
MQAGYAKSVILPVSIPLRFPQGQTSARAQTNPHAMQVLEMHETLISKDEIHFKEPIILPSLSQAFNFITYIV